MTALSRYFVHVVVLIVAIGLSGYATVSKGFPGVATLRLSAVNAEGLAFGQGGAAGGVQMGRAGTIIKPIAIPSDAPVEHTPTPYAVRQGEDVHIGSQQRREFRILLDRHNLCIR